MEKFQSGFKLAEIDLKLRGPGELFGETQSGFSDINLEWLTDINLLSEAREEAKKTLEEYGGIEAHPLLKEKLLEKFSETHFE